jgi:nucleoporin NDC1
LVRSFMMGLVTVMSWEFAESLFDAYVPQVIILCNGKSAF